MKPLLPRALSILVLLSLVFSQSSCTKEKAEALKTAAKDFRTQASVALDNLDSLFVQDVAFAPQNREDEVGKIVESLKNGPAGVRGINEILEYSPTPEFDTSKYSQKLNQIRGTYEAFEAMFSDLPRGHYFAGDAVERSEDLAKKLVAQMVFLALHIKEHPFKLNARLQTAVKKRDEALRERDQAIKDKKLTVLATELIALRDDTKAANEAAIRECVKGAETGLNVVRLIQNYKKMSVQDILSVVRDGIARVNLLTGKNTDGILTHLDEIEKKISDDPDWNAILSDVVSEMNAV